VIAAAKYVVVGAARDHSILLCEEGDKSKDKSNTHGRGATDTASAIRLLVPHLGPIGELIALVHSDVSRSEDDLHHALGLKHNQLSRV
jgi:hypothetical protein